MLTDTKKLIDVKILADWLGLSPASVWRHVGNGNLPSPFKVGGATRWRVSDIEKWLAEQ